MITSVRLGFATNSSSSHSIVLTNEKYAYKPSSDSFDFGWENFVLADKEDKLRYLALIIMHDLKKFLTPRKAALIVRDTLRGHLDLSNSDLSALELGYIDHQSAVSFPDFENPEARERIIRQAIAVFSSPNLVIFGGNDNDDSGKVLHDGEKAPRLGTSGWKPPLNARMDGDNIVFFNDHTGAKLRFSPSGSYEKSSVPELVDIKITDYCPYGCAFCYQGSTKDGVNKTLIGSWSLLEALGEMGVFEVALGGGETTMAKDFTTWISVARDRGIVPNFTTYSVAWLNDPYKVAAAKKCGGIGVSVHDIAGLQKVVKITEATRRHDDDSWNDGGPRITAQHVAGTLSVEDTADLISEAWRQKIHVLLLGYKSTGFGGKVSPHSMDGLAELLYEKTKEIRESYYCPCQLSCDTAFAVDNPSFVKQMNVASELVASPEGKFSCYIDAVTGKMGASSYGDPDEMRDLPLRGPDYKLAERITGLFASY